jgi:hypothetical protein
MGSKGASQRQRSPIEAAKVGVGLDIEPQAIGSYLRRQRELRGISAEELASLTRIPLRSLERLESGHFDANPDGFVRGFVRTVASALGLDPEDTVSRMLTEARPDETDELGFSPRWPRAVAGLAAVVLLAIAAGVIRYVTAEQPPVVAESGFAERVYRRDPVRALADSQRVSALDSAAAGPGAAAPQGAAAGQGAAARQGAAAALAPDAPNGPASVTLERRAASAQ